MASQNMQKLQQKIKDSIISYHEEHGPADLIGATVLIPKSLLDRLNIIAPSSDRPIVTVTPGGGIIEFKWELYDGSSIIIF